MNVVPARAPQPKPTGSALPAHATAYLDYLRFERRLSPRTIVNVERDLRDLAAFSATLPGCGTNVLTSSDIRRFLAKLHAGGMSPRAIARVLSGWRGYFRFTLRQGSGRTNPCDGARPPKAAKPLPRALSAEEAVRLVSFEDDSPMGIRDRAAFELLYSSGLRIAELSNLDLGSIDFAAREMRVLGKGSKMRIVPVGAPALAAVRRWLEVRTRMRGNDQPALFLGAQGRRIGPRVLQARIKQWAKRQGLAVDVHPHMLRHSFASHVLQSSENLRAVQELLGHASIASTQVYTHLDFAHLAKVYDAAHPRARKKTVKEQK